MTEEVDDNLIKQKGKGKGKEVAKKVAMEVGEGFSKAVNNEASEVSERVSRSGRIIKNPRRM